MEYLVLCDTKYGRPGQKAYRIWNGIEKRLSHDPRTTTFFLTRMELLALTGSVGGSGWSGTLKALHQLRRTDIHYRSAPIFNLRPNRVGQLQLIDFDRSSHPENPMLQCYKIVVDSRIARAYKKKNLYSFNESLMGHLTPQQHCYASILNFKFTGRYRAAIRKGEDYSSVGYSPSYERYCRLAGGLTHYTAPSTIVREQIVKQNQYLVDLGFLACLPELVPAKQTRWKIVFKPGQHFFIDYHRFYLGETLKFEHPSSDQPKHEKQASVNQPDLEEQEIKSVQEELELTDEARLFNRFNELWSPNEKLHMSDKALGKSQAVIKRLNGMYGAMHFIDWAVNKAKSSWPEMKSFGGLVKFLDEYERLGGAPRREQEGPPASCENEQRDCYDRYCRTEVPRLLDQMSGSESTNFHAEIDRQVASVTGIPGARDPKKLKQEFVTTALTRNGQLDNFVVWSQKEKRRQAELAEYR